jgi:hypothetical protein
MSKIWNNADFWAGIMFLGFGAVAVYISRDYPMGSAMRMGPGYFPTYLGILMMVMGLIVAAKGFVAGSEPIGRWAFRPLLILGLGVIAFGYVMQIAGFIPALVVLIVLASFAGRDFRPVELVILNIVLIAGAVGVFIYGIGLPYPLWGQF